MKIAPLILFTYKRCDSLKDSIGSLCKCELSKESELIVFSDAPKASGDKEDVAEVRDYLHSIEHFKKVTIIERSENLGVDYNIINGLKEISVKHESFIVIEDDLIYASNFLWFMNKALEFYSQMTEVMLICAFSYVDKIPQTYTYDTYVTKRSWPWGWASWGDRIKHVDWEVADYKRFSKDKKLQNEFNESGGSDLAIMLSHTMEGRMRTWDIRMFYYQFKSKLLTIYPTVSKTDNIGFHQFASHTWGYNRYRVDLDKSNSKDFRFNKNLTINETINKEFLKKNNITNRILTKLFSIFRMHRYEKLYDKLITLLS